MSLTEYDKSWCTRVINDLFKWQIAAPFKVPVDPVRDGALNYHSIVTNPMDFSTMKMKLNGDLYATVAEFIEDIRLICDNAKLFNGPKSLYGFICDDILKWTEEQYKAKANTQEDEWYRNLNTAIAKLQKHLQKAPPEILNTKQETI